MSAVVIGHIRVKDAAKWDRYRAQVPATLAPWGGELVLRGRDAYVLAGVHEHSDTVVLRFPDRSAAHGWHASDAYQALVALRTEAADVVLISFDSGV